MSISLAVPDVFDEPSLWRFEAAAHLGLANDDMVAVMSPGPAFPAALRSLRSALPIPPRAIVDLGAGCGGVSEWLRIETAATVYAVEPAAGARAVAGRAFPNLRVIDGRADLVPLPDGVADTVILSGILSLMSDVIGVLEEVDRLLGCNGQVVIADLFSSSGGSRRSAPNFFRSVEDLMGTLRRHGFTTTNVGCGAPGPDPSWSAAAHAVDDWIDEHCSSRAGYQQWDIDRRHLRHQARSGAVIGGCIVAVR